MEIRKLPASAGAEWLLGAFRLLRKSPLGFGLLGLVYGVLWLAMVVVLTTLPALAVPAQVAFFLAGPLLLAGMVFAAHEVDEGRSALPGHLLAAVRTGRAGRIITTLIPQIGLVVLCFGLFYLMVGAETVEKLSKLFLELQAQAQTQAQPKIDPEMINALPFGRIMIWMVLMAAILFVGMLFTMTVVPDMMFTDVRLIAAMKRSFRACIANLPALFVFLIMGVVVTVAAGFAIAILGALGSAIAGDKAMLVINALTNGLFATFAASAMYFAWKQMLGDDATPPPVSSGIAV